jgi:prepilin-type N-terminal cleavage/methylation domain-containing protein
MKIRLSRKGTQRPQKNDLKLRPPFFSATLCALRFFAAKKIAPRPSQARGFTLMEMMITLAIFILLAAAVFGLMTGVLQSTSTLQDNQNRRDQIESLNAFLKNKLSEMPATGTLSSYQRGDGEGLVQNGIIFGTATLATAVDATPQANGYYALRLTTLAGVTLNGQSQDARQTLLQLVTTDDPSLVWTPLITDIKTLDWKFEQFNVTPWVDLWNSPPNPNLVEFSMQPTGETQPTTMDFWIPTIQPITVRIAAPPTSH